jgi:predicted ATPase/DNA-binding XRE family transcriptional regulator
MAGKEAREAAKPTEFGRRLRGLREAAGLSQEELAARAGLTAKGIGALERGERRHPQPHTLRSLAGALDLSEADRNAFFAAAPKRAGGASSPPEGKVDTFALPATLPAAPPTLLLGRERDVAAVLSLLEKGDARLLTLTGPGGVGKTRLALEVAGDAKSMFADGVSFVALASLNDADLVLPTLVRTLGLSEIGGRSVREILREHLRERRMLLVLDNFEHVMGATSEVADILGECPDLVVLTTSRAALRVRGEHNYPVRPLVVPDSTHNPDMRIVAASPAGRLFMDRATEANASFELTDKNAASVAAICWRLDGLPLALELAAAKARYLGPTELLSRLDRALEVGGARDLPERQRTMRATLEWSHELLSDEERALFRRLSVFAGGFGLEAVETVGGAGEAGESGAEDALDLLGGLVEQSLVTAEPDGLGGTRYRMLEPIRQFALENLRESGEEEEARRQHAGYYLDLAERAAPELRRARAPEWLDRLGSEHDNLRSAVTWALAGGEIELAARLAFQLARFFWSHGPHGEVLRWMKEALAADSAKAGAMSAGARARARYVAAVMDYRLGGYESLQSVSKEAAAIKNEGDLMGAADALMVSGLASMRAGEPERATALLEESRSLFASIGNEHGLAMTTVHLGAIPLSRGDLERAGRLFQRGLELAQGSGDPMSLYTAHYHLALAAQAEGLYAEACLHYALFIETSQRARDRQNLGYALLGLTECWAAREDPERAARLLGAAEALFESLGMPFHYYNMSASFHERHLDVIREKLDPETFQAARADGRAMTLEEAVAEALAEGA